MELPQWFHNFIKSIYYQAGAYANINGSLVLLSHFASGVLQGCPASAFLFNLALDPFLAEITTYLEIKMLGLLGPVLMI